MKPVSSLSFCIVCNNPSGKKTTLCRDNGRANKSIFEGVFSNYMKPL